ncbi:potassium two pore domain channel subfamily K member galene [Haematobia irritans]|uniref:potassium two pore domain channel subfamily K member galene n=1 Tax=Haematobia irritans TaxID=7368 RepID=UPI003F4F5BB4
MSTRRAHSLPPHMLEPVKRERGRCVTAICFSWKVITCIVSHVTLILMVVCYCVGGAYLFQHLEGDHETEVKKDIHKMRYNLTEIIWKHSDNQTFLQETEWKNQIQGKLKFFEQQILTAMKTNGWDGDDNVNTTQWTFAGSLFYSIIVITTIGYGHISPRTDWGKVTTIFYAIVGIPLMLLCLSNIGDVMATSFRFIYWRVCCYICTRNAHKNRRNRQRSIRAHRYASRSQPPPLRRSIRMSHRPGHGELKHAYSDPELRTTGRNGYDRDFDYDRHNDRRFQQSVGRERRRDNHMLTAPPISRGGSRHQIPYDDDPMLDEGPPYTQTLNRGGGRFSGRQSRRDRMHDRHTVERERHLSRSKHHFDSMEDLEDLPPTTKRAMSVRSMRSPQMKRDEISRDHRESKEMKELNRLNAQHNLQRGKSMPHSNARARAKSVDPRLSAPQYEEVDEEVVRKTPIISNRYAITEMEHRESRSKSYMRSQSMPRSAFHKNSLNHPPTPTHHHSSTRHYADDLGNRPNGGNRRSVPLPNTNHSPRRGSFGRQTSLGPLPSNGSRYGNHLELPEYTAPHRMKRGPSPRRHEIYDEEYEDQYIDDPDEYMRPQHMDRRDLGDRNYDDIDYHRSSMRREKRPRKEKQERLPPSPRIMSPMGFAVKRQIRRRPSYDYDDDSMYGDEMSDYYGDIPPKDRPVPIWLCVFLVISYILGGAALFAYWEKWSFLDSAYFCFITLTTIGFGDFVPAKGVKDESEQSIAYCSLYLLFGIALLAMSFNLVQEEFIANVKEVARRLGILKDEDDDDD